MSNDFGADGIYGRHSHEQVQPMPVLKIGVASILAALVVAGCVTFAEYETRPPARDSSVRNPTRSISLQVTEESYIETIDGSWSPVDLSAHSDMVEPAIRETNLFLNVDMRSTKEPVRATVVVRRYQGFMYGGLLGLASGFVIPIKHHVRIEVDLTLETTEGASSKASRHKEFSVWTQLFLLPLYFNHSPAAFEQTLVRRLTDECVREATSVLAGESSA